MEYPKNNPKAYWAFQTECPKEDVRDILSSLFMEKMGMETPYQYTPWKLNLFREEEFERYNDPLEAGKKLTPLRGWEGASDKIPFLSPANMINSYFLAQKMIQEDSNLEKFVKKSKERNLNYIIQANHDGLLQKASYNGSLVVLDLLSEISLEFFRTDIGRESKDFRNQLKGYYENNQEQRFKIIDGYQNEIEL